MHQYKDPKSWPPKLLLPLKLCCKGKIEWRAYVLNIILHLKANLSNLNWLRGEKPLLIFSLSRKFQISAGAAPSVPAEIWNLQTFKLSWQFPFSIMRHPVVCFMSSSFQFIVAVNSPSLMDGWICQRMLALHSGVKIYFTLWWKQHHHQERAPGLIDPGVRHYSCRNHLNLSKFELLCKVES